MTSLLLIVGLLAQTVVRIGPAPPPTAPASVQAQKLAAPVLDAYARIEAEEAAAPPAATNRQRLERLFKRDQAGREALEHVDLTAVSKEDQQAAQQIMWSVIGAHDLLDQAELKALTPKEGWFPISVYGRAAAQAAFLVVQHAVNDEALMRSTLAALDRMRLVGEADGDWYALMYDRVALEFDKKPQRYGSQAACEAGTWRARDLEDPAHVDARRKAVGLDDTEAEYLAQFKDMPCS